MALRTRKLGSGSKLPAKPRRMWTKIVPLVAVLAVGGAAAYAVFGGKKGVGAEVQEEKKTREEKRREEKKKKYGEKLETLKRIIKFQRLKEQGENSWGENEDGVYFPPFDEKRYMEGLGDYTKNELWDLLSEQLRIVWLIQQEHKNALNNMDIELSTGKKVPSEEEEKEERLILAKLKIEKRKQDLVQGRIDEIEISEYGLAGKSREELQAILFSMEEKAMYWGVEYLPWEEEQTMYLASIALDRLFWSDVLGKE